MNGVGRVLGTDDATPLEFWVALGPGHHLQLDDVVAVDRELRAADLMEAAATRTPRPMPTAYVC